MRSRVTISDTHYDNGEIIIDAGRDKGQVQEGTFFAHLDPVDGRILSIWRVVQVKYSISMLEMVWKDAVQTTRLERGDTLARMDVVESRVGRKK